MIIVEIKETTNCFGDFSAYFTFNYNPDIIKIIKATPERYWLPEQKVWEVPLKYLDKLLVELKPYGIKVLNEEKHRELTPEPVNIHIPTNYAFKTTPYSHQFKGIEYGLNHNRFLLGDEQGLGKTMQAINIAVIKKQLNKYKHCLIICGVNGLKWNWFNEVKKHSDEDAYILGTRLNSSGNVKIGSIDDRFEDLQGLIQQTKDLPYFLITNVETLRNEGIQSLLRYACNHEIINMIIFDEFHKVKNPTSQQGKSILKLEAETMIAMTGTPLMNSPIDLYMPLKWLGFELHSYYQFKNHYCVMGGYGNYQIVGYKNLEQLQNQFEEISLRRLKKDVLDLPDKIYTTDYVEMLPKQSKIYKEVKAEIKENIDMICSSPNPLAEMIRLRQATGFTGILSSKIQESAKFDRLEELLEEIDANNEKAIIFSNWISITNPLYERLKKYNPAIITGETKDRVAEEQKLMNDNTCKIIIGTIGAMGTGLTLTAASTVIFLDEPWNRALKEQAEDRAHRIGTKSNVNIITLICKDTIDERIHDLLLTKGALADMLVDGVITAESKKQLINFLLS